MIRATATLCLRASVQQYLSILSLKYASAILAPVNPNQIGQRPAGTSSGGRAGEKEIVDGGQGGLEEAVVADISTSYIDGSIGKLIYHGYAIEDLAENATFEEVLFLLFKDRLPNRAEYEALRSAIARDAAIPDEVIAMLKSLPRETSGMAALRTAVSMLSAFDSDAENLTDKEAAKAKAIRLTGQITAVCAAWMRIAKGEEPTPPRADLSVAENFVYMMSGGEPDATACAALNVYLVLLAEHGMNASTFTARVVTATGSDMHSAIVAGIGALKGPSHGGANSAAMKMFLEIGEVENVVPWFEKYIKTGERRIMGIGHRVYNRMIRAQASSAVMQKRWRKARASASGMTSRSSWPRRRAPMIILSSAIFIPMSIITAPSSYTRSTWTSICSRRYLPWRGLPAGPPMSSLKWAGV